MSTMLDTLLGGNMHNHWVSIFLRSRTCTAALGTRIVRVSRNRRRIAIFARERSMINLLKLALMEYLFIGAAVLILATDDCPKELNIKVSIGLAVFMVMFWPIGIASALRDWWATR